MTRRWRMWWMRSPARVATTPIATRRNDGRGLNYGEPDFTTWTVAIEFATHPGRNDCGRGCRDRGGRHSSGLLRGLQDGSRPGELFALQREVARCDQNLLGLWVIHGGQGWLRRLHDFQRDGQS